MISTVGSSGSVINKPPQEKQPFQPSRPGTQFRPSIQSSKFELKPDNSARKKKWGIAAGITGIATVAVGGGVGIAALQAKQRKKEEEKEIEDTALETNPPEQNALETNSPEQNSSETNPPGHIDDKEKQNDIKFNENKDSGNAFIEPEDEKIKSLQELKKDQIAEMKTADLSAKLIDIYKTENSLSDGLGVDKKVEIFNNIKKNLSNFKQDGLKVITDEIQSATEHSEFAQKQIAALKEAIKNNQLDPEAAAATEEKLAKYEVLLANLTSDLSTLKHDQNIIKKNFTVLENDVNSRVSKAGNKDGVLDQSLLINFINFIQSPRTNIDKLLSELKPPEADKTDGTIGK